MLYAFSLFPMSIVSLSVGSVQVSVTDSLSTKSRRYSSSKSNRLILMQVATKIVPPKHFEKLAIMNLLGIVDYDLDEGSSINRGSVSGFDLAASLAIEPDGNSKLAATAGLINHDQQSFVRPI